MAPFHFALCLSLLTSCRKSPSEPSDPILRSGFNWEVRQSDFDHELALIKSRLSGELTEQQKNSLLDELQYRAVVWGRLSPQERQQAVQTVQKTLSPSSPPPPAPIDHLAKKTALEAWIERQIQNRGPITIHPDQIAGYYQRYGSTMKSPPTAHIMLVSFQEKDKKALNARARDINSKIISGSGIPDNTRGQIIYLVENPQSPLPSPQKEWFGLKRWEFWGPKEQPDGSYLMAICLEKFPERPTPLHEASPRIEQYLKEEKTRSLRQEVLGELK